MKLKNTRSHTPPFPVARTENLIVQELGGETLIYDKLTHKAFCLNATAAMIWKACDGRTSANDITRRLTRLSDSAVACEVVLLGLRQLSAQNLLAELPARAAHAPVNAPTLASRRAALRTLGITAAIAIPTVTAIVAPTAAHAATGGGSGSACSTNSQCNSGLCINGVCS